MLRARLTCPSSSSGARLPLPPEEATRVTWPVSQLGKWRRELETRAGLRSGLCLPPPQ